MGKTYDFDYENTSFNWDLINGEYDEQSSKESCDEVAKLVYACAVGMETAFDYDSGIGSSSSVAMAKRFLLENFKYSADAEILGMGNFSTDEWNDIIYKELQASRPVYMQGGTHAFVCDGYGGDKYFHFNWGWGSEENGNGYFLLSALKPNPNDDYDFTIDLQAMINIHKREGGKEPYTYDIICNGEVVLYTIDVSQSIGVDFGCWRNYSRYDIVDGSMYLEYVNTETLESQYVYIHNGINIKGTAMEGPFVAIDGVYQGTILPNTNSQLAPGKYKIYPAYSVAESPIKRVRCLAGARQYISLTVTDNHECIYANSEDVVASNAKVAIDYVANNVGIDKTSGVKTTDIAIALVFTLKNYSDNYPLGNLTFSIINEDGVEVKKLGIPDVYVEPNNERTGSLMSSVYLQPGKHQIKCFDAYGNDITEKPFYFQVEGEPHTLEIEQVTNSNYLWWYDLDIVIKSSHPAGNIVPDLSMKLLKDGDEIYSRSIQGRTDNRYRIILEKMELVGEYQIDIHDVYGNRLKNSPYSITIPPVSVALSDTAITLKEGESYTLTATIEPSTASVQWSSSNYIVDICPDGNNRATVTARVAGTDTITARVGKKTATCVVTTVDTSNNIGQLKVDNARHPADIYDLTGRKVIDPKNLKRGIYIVNGKKVIVK